MGVGRGGGGGAGLTAMSGGDVLAYKSSLAFHLFL